MAGALGFFRVALGSRRVPAFEVGVDGSILCCYQHPAWFGSPRSRGDNSFEIVGKVRHLRACHEGGLLSREVGREELMKLRGVEVRETVRGFFYRAGFAQVTGESLSVVSFILSQRLACEPRCTPTRQRRDPSRLP